MELKTNYQYTYFIYPFAIKKTNYNKYIYNLIKNKKYNIKFFDAFKDIELCRYFVPSIKEKLFQDFSYTAEKISKLKKLSLSEQKRILSKENCLIFEYIIDNNIQGKIEEKDGIFFNISKIEIVCFKTGICFMLLKTHLVESSDFKDVLNFNYKFANLKLEDNKITKIKNIKIQTNNFSSMKAISELIEDITGKKIENRQIDIDENLFLSYTYVCLNSENWNKEKGFTDIENEFIKLSEVKPSDAQINVDYDKLSLLTDTTYKKIRVGSNNIATICSSSDSDNYTKFPILFENQYLYTYLIALHQRYYLKKLNNMFKENEENAIYSFLDFSKNIWISDVTSDSFGQKLYKRCIEKLNLEALFNETKSKYDIFYKNQNIVKTKKIKKILIFLMILASILGIANIAYIKFYFG